MDPDKIGLNDLLNEAAGSSPAQTNTDAQSAAATSTDAQSQASNEEVNNTNNQEVNQTAASTDNNQAQQAQQTPEGTNKSDDNSQAQSQSQTQGQQAQNKSNPMKEVRDKLNAEQKSREKIEGAIQRFTSGDYDLKLKDFKTEDGKVDYDALIAAMDKKDIEKKATERGITPEVQAEIDRIEKEKVELQKERLKVAMDRAVSNMQIDLNLDKNAINQFFADSLSLKKNPYQWLAQGGTLDELYYLIYRDKLTKAATDKAVAEAKAEWEKANSKVAPTPNPAKQSTNNGNSDTLSLDQLLNEAAKNTK